MVAAWTGRIGGLGQCKAGWSGLHRRPIMTTSTKPARNTKSASVHRMLRRDKGATLAEIEKATCWKPHSCRAFLSGVRKTGATLAKEERPDGKTAYRITAGAEQCPA
jgi:uncharacterized protein DUF3489